VFFLLVTLMTVLVHIQFSVSDLTYDPTYLNAKFRVEGVEVVVSSCIPVNVVYLYTFCFYGSTSIVEKRILYNPTLLLFVFHRMDVS
jgi:hypothetical protein